jgi:Uma2 family endonuclease
LCSESDGLIDADCSPAHGLLFAQSQAPELAAKRKLVVPAKAQQVIAMNAVLQSKKASYDDLLALPEGMVGEIIFGVLHAQPRPRATHALAASALQSDLDASFRRGRGGPGGWVMLMEPELHLQEHVLVPDLAGWRRERFPSLADDPAALSVVPDWICEIVSPATARIDRTTKRRLYRQLGVDFYWLINPAERTLEAFARDEGGWKLVAEAAESEHVRAPPFEAIVLELQAWWTP